jgi:hypothetical protein
MIRIDDGAMRLATSCGDSKWEQIAPRDCGYLNRTTGEVVFALEKDADGPGIGIYENAAVRYRVGSSPDWVKVPRFDRDADFETLVAEFLLAEGIEAELV